MTLADKIHKMADGKRWYAPLTLGSYWISGVFCFWVTASTISEGHFDYLWKGLRLLADDRQTLNFKEQPIAFTLLVFGFILCGLALILIGWLKFTRRRSSYLANAKYL